MRGRSTGNVLKEKDFLEGSVGGSQMPAMRNYVTLNTLAAQITY
jgi:hypothetical protein